MTVSGIHPVCFVRDVPGPYRVSPYPLPCFFVSIESKMIGKQRAVKTMICPHIFQKNLKKKDLFFKSEKMKKEDERLRRKELGNGNEREVGPSVAALR